MFPPSENALDTCMLKDCRGVWYCVYCSLIKTRSPSTSTNHFVVYQKVTKERYWFIYLRTILPSLEKSVWICSRLVWQMLSSRTSNIATLTILSAILECIALVSVHQSAVGHSYRSKVFWLLKISQSYPYRLCKYHPAPESAKLLGDILVVVWILAKILTSVDVHLVKVHTSNISTIVFTKVATWARDFANVIRVVTSFLPNRVCWALNNRTPNIATLTIFTTILVTVTLVSVH